MTPFTQFHVILLGVIPPLSHRRLAVRFLFAWLSFITGLLLPPGLRAISQAGSPAGFFILVAWVSDSHALFLADTGCTCLSV